MSSIATQPARASGEFAIGGDLAVVRLGYGSMQIPGPGVWGEPRDHDEVIRVLRRAVELGVTLIDTADSYGPGVSEQLIREALHPYPADLAIATKAGFMRPGPGRWERNGKPDYLKAQAEKSLRRLGLERIELFQLHRIDPKVPLGRHRTEPLQPFRPRRRARPRVLRAREHRFHPVVPDGHRPSGATRRAAATNLR